MKKYTTRAIEKASEVLNFSKECLIVLFEAKQHLTYTWSYVLMVHPESQTWIVVWGIDNEPIRKCDVFPLENETLAYKALFNAMRYEEMQ